MTPIKYTTQKGIYSINFSNGKRYIGMSNNIEHRIKEHCLDAKKGDLLPVHKAMNVMSYEVEILEDCQNMTRQEMGNRERYWISYFGTFNNKEKGYNLTEGGDGANSGVANYFAKFNEQQIQEIYDLLINHLDLYIYQIASMYDVSPDAISAINRGKTYFNDFLKYPLRPAPKPRVGEGIQNHQAKFKTQEQFDKIYYDLLDNKLSLQEIAIENNVSYTTISKINRGLSYPIENYKYPIRKNKKNTSKISQKDIEQIIELLINTKLNYTEIGERFGVVYSTIARIDSGKYHKQNKYTYPIRANKEINKAVSTISASGE